MKRGALLAVALFGTLGTAVWLASQPVDDDVAAPAAARSRGSAEAADTRRQDAPAMRRDDRVDNASRGAVGWPEPPSPRGPRAWREPALAAAWMPSAVPAPAAAPAAPAPPRIAVAEVAAAPAPPPTAPERAEPPQAPPFPYMLIGRIEDDGVARAVLAGAHRTLGVKASDVIDSQWRVDHVDATTLTLTWLPGGQQQTLQLRPS